MIYPTYKFLFLILLMIVFNSCNAQDFVWHRVTIKNTVEGYTKGRIMDHGDRWLIYFNDEVMVCNYKDTIPILWTEIIDGVEQEKQRKDSYINQYYIYPYKGNTVIKYDVKEDGVLECEITLDSLRHVIATFSIIPFITKNNQVISNVIRGDTTINSFLTLNKPDWSYPDSTYLVRIPAEKYALPISLFPQLDNASMKTTGYIMIYNPTVVEGHNIPRREFSTVIYPGVNSISPEIEKIYADFKRDR